MYQQTISHISGCQKFTYDNAYHNRMFTTCGATTFNLAAMVFFILRDKVGLERFGYSYDVHDHKRYLKGSKKTYMTQIIIRLFIFNLLLLLFFFLKREVIFRDRVPGTDITYQLALLLGTMMAPLMLIAYLLNAGFYDGAVTAVQRALRI